MSGSVNKEFDFVWEGQDKLGKRIRGVLSANNDVAAGAMLRRQGVTVTKIKKSLMRQGKPISRKDIAALTRQLAQMMKAGINILQSFAIMTKGASNPRVAKLMSTLSADIETGSGVSASFRRHPEYFGDLFCNLLEAGERGGILDDMLERLADYEESSLALRKKVKGALVYPISVLTVAFLVLAIIMIFVIPAFKDIFSSFGATLPGPTLVVMGMSEFFVSYWYLIFGSIGGAIYGIKKFLATNKAARDKADALSLKLPVFGVILQKSAVARWTRSLQLMFAAGVPLVESLNYVGGAAANAVYVEATRRIRADVAGGVTLSQAMSDSDVFDNFVIAMANIGEESGTLDSMMARAATVFEADVDEAVSNLSALMEPFIIVLLGGIIGSIVVAMYMPMFKLGSVV